MDSYSGTIYSYSFLCPRKVWLAYHNLNRESENKDVELGALIDENAYKRFSHNIRIDDICIDYMDKKVIYEIKKSDKRSDMAVAQVKYYLYTLYQKGARDITGCINYPLLKKKEYVELTKKDIAEIDVRLHDIDDIVEATSPPAPIDKPVCKRCAYYELCYV